MCQENMAGCWKESETKNRKAKGFALIHVEERFLSYFTISTLWWPGNKNFFFSRIENMPRWLKKSETKIWYNMCFSPNSWFSTIYSVPNSKCLEYFLKSDTRQKKTTPADGNLWSFFIFGAWNKKKHSCKAFFSS